MENVGATGQSGIGPAATGARKPGPQLPGPATMNGDNLQRKVRINNPQGFHMRPASLFAQAANQYQSTVFLCKDNQRINGKSPLELMVLGADQGTELTLEVSGPDAHEAIEALARLLAAPWDETAEPPSVSLSPPEGSRERLPPKG